jgi:homoserine O-acetyltransferase
MGVPFLQYLTFGTPDDPFHLVGGGSLPEVTVAYETWGALSPARDNAVLITTGLSASSHVARHRPDDDEGWWDEMVGPGRPIDTDRFFVVCSNILGGCFGTTGPASHDPRTGRPYGMHFPTITPEDMVNVQARLIEHLGISRLRGVLGSSLGGMLALQMAALHPERVRSAAGIATPGRAYSFSIAWRAVQRWMVMNDPRWNGGDYPPGEGPSQTLTLARAVGMLSYRSPQEFDKRFGRDFNGVNPFDLSGHFEVESYLLHNAAKFGRRFDANCYLYLARAMDLFDLGRGAPSYPEGVARIRCPTLIVGFTSDLLFPVAQQREVAGLLRERQRPVRYVEFETVHGHDAFLIDIERLGAELTAFLEDPERVAAAAAV